MIVCLISCPRLYADDLSLSSTQVLERAISNQNSWKTVTFDAQTLIDPRKIDTSQPPDASKILVIDQSSAWSFGRMRVESTKFDIRQPEAPRVSQQTTSVFDGTMSQRLIDRRSADIAQSDTQLVGQVDFGSFETALLDGTWILNGSTPKVLQQREGVHSTSLLKQMLHQSSEPVAINQISYGPDAGRYELASKLPWGNYQVTIDPAKNYAMTKVIIELDNIPAYDYLGPSTGRYEIVVSEFENKDGQWFPAAYTLKSDEVIAGKQFEQQYPDQVVLKNIKFSDEPLPDSVFKIKFPPEALVHDNILGITYGSGKDHALDKVYAEVISDKEAALGLEPGDSGSTSAAPQSSAAGELSTENDADSNSAERTRGTSTDRSGLASAGTSPSTPSHLSGTADSANAGASSALLTDAHGLRGGARDRQANGTC